MYCIKCGEKLVESAKFCSACGKEKAERQQATPNSSITAKGANDVGALKSKKKLLIGLGGGVAVILISGGFMLNSGPNSLNENFDTIAAEITASETGGSDSYEAYKTRTDNDRAIETAGLREEKAAFETAQSSGHITDLGKFAEDYPDGEFFDLAQEEALSSLRRQKTAAAYKTFKKYFPDTYVTDYTGVEVIKTGNGRYEGPYNDDGQQHGKGIYSWDDGDRYEGDYLDDKRTGKGKFFFKSGDLYEGDFVDGIWTGKGKYFYSNGDRYEGDYLDDKQTGKGKFFFKSGDRYEGDYVDGIWTGKGKYFYSNGNRYEGDFVDDKMTGKGKLFFKSGDRYEGDFVDSKRIGQGKSYRKDKLFYTGSCRDGLADGWGTVYFEGYNFEGRFSDGHPVGEIVSEDDKASIDEDNKVPC